VPCGICAIAGSTAAISRITSASAVAGTSAP
jgi:hypothetical protein